MRFPTRLISNAKGANQMPTFRSRRTGKDLRNRQFTFAGSIQDLEARRRAEREAMVEALRWQDDGGRHD